MDYPYVMAEKPKFSYFLGKGFTLIELMVVIMIMVLVFAVGFANYRGFQRRKVLEGAVEALKGDLRFTQQQALSSNKPAGCASTESLNSYIFRFVNSTSYEIVARCLPGPNDVTVKAASDTNISTKYPGVTINSFPDVVFNLLGRGVVSDVTITLSQPAVGNSETIDITEGGEIK